MAKKNKLEGRIRFDENCMGKGEHFVFEIKWTDEEQWGMEKAFPVVKAHDTDEECTMLHYTALTQIREWQKLGIQFHFE